MSQMTKAQAAKVLADAKMVSVKIGDTLQVTLGVVPSAAYRVAAVSVSAGDPEPLWQVQFVPV